MLEDVANGNDVPLSAKALVHVSLNPLKMNIVPSALHSRPDSLPEP
jgi:hypothetical protein